MVRDARVSKDGGHNNNLILRGSALTRLAPQDDGRGETRMDADVIVVGGGIGAVIVALTLFIYVQHRHKDEGGA